jgi:DNA-binding response OmpR family regulator
MAILIADQSESVRSLLRLLLEGAGHAVREAVDSSKALVLSERQSFGVVFVDGGLAPEDGIETARRIHVARPDQEVVLMSHAADSSRLRTSANGAGIRHILAKPVIPHAFLQIVRQLVREANP